MMLEMLPPRTIRPYGGKTTLPCRVMAAETAEQRNLACALRYQAYRRLDTIADNPAARFSDAHDHDCNALSYVIVDNQANPIGSVRASVYLPDRDEAIPCVETHRDELAARIGPGRRIVEASHLVLADTSLDVAMDLRIGLFRLIWANALIHNADWIVASVPSRHVAMYQRLFHFQVLAEPRYRGGPDLESVLCGAPREAFVQAVQRQPGLQIGLTEAWWYAL